MFESITTKLKVSQVFESITNDWKYHKCAKTCVCINSHFPFPAPLDVPIEPPSHSKLFFLLLQPTAENYFLQWLPSESIDSMSVISIPQTLRFATLPYLIGLATVQETGDGFERKMWHQLLTNWLTHSLNVWQRGRVWNMLQHLKRHLYLLDDKKLRSHYDLQNTHLKPDIPM